VPTIWVRTPYNFNFWDVHNGVPADMTRALTAVKRGYAYVVQNERGHFFSEGNYDILGSKTDGYNTVDWLTKQPWSNGKIGTTGCSSTAEYQMGVAALGHPGYAAMNVQGSAPASAASARTTSRATGTAAGRSRCCSSPGSTASRTRCGRCSARDITRGFDSRLEVVRIWRSICAGRLVQGAVAPAGPGHHQGRRRSQRDLRRRDEGGNGRTHDSADAERRRVVSRRLYHDDMKLNVPGLWFMSWYDVSVGPNLALFNHVRKTRLAGDRGPAMAIIAPVAHCAYTRATADTIVGERSMGDARFDYNDIVYGFFDRFEGRDRRPARLAAEGHLLHDGADKWQTARHPWPPAGAQPMTFFLSERRQSHTLHGDGRAAAAAPDADKPDAVTYDPMNPVLSYGGNVCCTGTRGRRPAPSTQRRMEARDDILVYTSEAVQRKGPR
jgi:putative CocE/NonD family hydrolase